MTEYVSQAELMRAAQAERAAFARYCEPVQPPQGDPAFIEELIDRAEKYLARYPDSVRAANRLAALQEERDGRLRAWQLTWQHLERLAQRYEELSGDPCPKVRAGQDSVQLRRPCWIVKEIVGHECALREAMGEAVS